MDKITPIWEQVHRTHPDPAWWLVGGAALLAAVAVASRRVWPISRNLVTIAHEGGHALAALATGRRLAGIRLHSDTSGVTVSAGRPTGPGMVLTAAAGYTAPSLLGLAGAWVLAAGFLAALLWGTLTLLVGMFVMIRNLYGALAVVVTGAAIFTVSWWAPAAAQAAVGHLLVWFLLLAGPRPVWELHLKRRLGEAPDSDADQLARLTGIPGTLWVTTFAAVTLVALGLGGRLLLT